MNKDKENSESREGLLRRSLDNAYRPSFDSDLDLDELNDYQDPIHDRAQPPVNAYQTATNQPRLQSSFFARRSKCLLVLLAVVAIFWLTLAGGGIWLYHVPPADGRSPPWYPTPAGGTVASWKDSYEKASKLVEKMTLPEKVNITTGTGWMMGLAVGNTGPALNVGFPGLALQDGPLGIRMSDHATAFPAGITVGATWNRELMYARGKAHGLEARGKGVNVLLGPCVGPLGRMPAGGRNWEGFGSDPYLQGVAAAETIKGIQSQGIIATIKHFVGNEQEHFRQSREWQLKNALSSNIGDRTMHELYLWPFADAVKAGVASVMCSYQMTNNSYSCGNSKLLNGILKDELGFQGFVQSDWLAQRSGVATALSGLDMSMPGDGLAWQDGASLWGPELTKAVLNTSIPISRLNDMVTRVVAAWYQLGQDDEKLFDRKGPNFSSWTDDEKGHVNNGSPDDKDLVVVNQYVDVQGKGDDAHSIIARKVAAEGTVLLKNADNVLPLNRDGWSDKDKQDRKYRVAIFGEDAGAGQGPNFCKDRACNQGTLASGWGSGAVEFPYLVTPISALKKIFNPDKVDVGDFLTNSPSWKTTAGLLQDRDLCLVFANADSGEGFVSADSIRGDRNDLNLQKGGDILISEVAKRCGGGNSPTVVIIHSVGPVLVEKWIDIPGVKAVIMANLPGQESGNALVDILFGDVNPSGKLPYTIGKSLDDYGEGAKILYYPNGLTPQQDYGEGLYIDYRHFDKYNINPRFEFGFGLSYTTFEYSSIKIETVKPKSRLPSPRPDTLPPPSYDEKIPDPATALFPAGLKRLSKFIYPYVSDITEIKPGPYPYPVGYDVKQNLSQAGGGEGGNPSLYDIHYKVHVTLKNTGTVQGSEVAQLYLSYPGSPSPNAVHVTSTKSEEESRKWKFDTDMTDFPVRVLRGFEKVMLKAGEQKDVVFELTRRDLSFWDTREQNWVLETEGEFGVAVGGSSRDVRVEGKF